MSNPFDDRLTQKIREAFEQYNDDRADYGWLELRKKYPVKNRRKPLYYWLGSAAAVLVLGFGVWALSPIALQQSGADTKKLTAGKTTEHPEPINPSLQEHNTTGAHLPQKMS